MSDIMTPCAAKLTPVERAGMITLRGDLASAAMAEAVKKVTGAAVPAANRCSIDGDRGVAWMSPDELLVLTPYDAAIEAASQIGAALKGVHHLAEVVSDARAVFRIEGADAREVLGKLTPADLSPEAFGPGDFRRSRLGQVAAAFWMVESGTIGVVCFRSVGDYLENLLATSIAGGRVGFH